MLKLQHKEEEKVNPESKRQQDKQLEEERRIRKILNQKVGARKVTDDSVKRYVEIEKQRNLAKLELAAAKDA